MKDLKARQVAKARSWKKVQAMRRQATYWRNLWQTNPGPLAANLQRINSQRKEWADARTRVIATITATLPDTIPSIDLKAKLRDALANAGKQSDPKAVTRLLSNLRRRRLIAFDLARLVWLVAKNP